MAIFFDFFERLYVPNITTKDVNVKVFNMITKINESKLSGKHTLYDWKWIFDGTKCNLNQNKTTIIGDANIENLKQHVYKK